MNVSAVKQKATDLFSEASFVRSINNEVDYQNALELMDNLIEDYDKYLPLIEMLSLAIEKWEENAEAFVDFNASISNLNDGVAVLKVLMDQFNLKAEDLKAELGSKSLVSMLLKGTRNLTREHIQALSNRFNVSPSLFFSTSRRFTHTS